MELIDTKIYDEFTVDMYFSDQSDLIDLVPRHRIIVRDGEVSVGKTNKGRIYEILMKNLSLLREQGDASQPSFSLIQ